MLLTNGSSGESNGNEKSQRRNESEQPSDLTPKQVARAMGVSESSVKRWCDAGLIHSTVTAGGHRRLSLESVQEFLKTNNHLNIDPDIFSLNFSFGKSERALERGKDDFVDAYLHGSESQMRQIIADYLDAGRAPAVIFDHILFAARDEIRRRIQIGKVDPYVDRFGAEICLRLMFELRSGFPSPKTTAPTAFTASLDGATDALRVDTADVLLYHQGWKSRAVGTMIPFQQLELLIREHRPDLLYLDVEEIRSFDGFFRELAQLIPNAESHATKLILGGTVRFDDERLRPLAFTAVPEFETLLQQAQKEFNRLRH